MLLLAGAGGIARAADPAGSAPSAGTEREAQAIVDRWIKAIGGLDQLNRVKTVHYTAQVGYNRTQTGLELRVRARPGGFYRIEYALPRFGLVSQTYDGKVAWQSNPMLGFGPLPPAEHQANLQGLDFEAGQYRRFQQSQRRVLEDETIGGRRLQGVQLSSNRGVEKWYFDPATGYRVRIEQGSGRTMRVTEFDDFRTAEGLAIKQPFKTTRLEGDRRMEIAHTSIRFNETLDPGAFTASPDERERHRQIERILTRHAEFAGSEALRRVNTRTMEQEVEVTTSGFKMNTLIRQKRPNLLLLEQDNPTMGKVWRGFDGKVGWSWSEVEGYREMRGGELAQMLDNADLEGPIRLVERCPLRLPLPDKNTNGRTLLGLQLSLATGPAGKFYFDAGTGELVEVETVVQAGPNGQLPVLAEFSDYRKIDGVAIPFVTTVSNPAVRMVMTVRKVEQNVPLDDALFVPKRK